jgi:hemerythrin superfamily protein
VDAIQLILSDHRDLERLFKEFERAEHSGNLPRQAEIVREIVRELSVHASVEEQFVYPALRQATGDTPVLDALEEHHAAKLTLDELDALPPRNERYAAKVRFLVENVRRHIEEEERELLPALERALDEGQRRELGETLAIAKRAAPTRPHPLAPDTPPGNFLSSAFAAVIDRSRDALRGGTEVLGTITRVSAKSGLGAARGMARKAQERSREAVNGAIDRSRAAVDEARTRGREAVSDAAKRTRQATDRVEVRGTEAAKTVGRTGRSAERAANERVGVRGRRSRSAARRRARARESR